MQDLAGDAAVSAIEVPPSFTLLERRLSKIAEAAWARADCLLVPGFDDNSVLVDDPQGRAWLTRVGDAIGLAFGLVAGVPLERRDALTAELCAACDLIALHPEPLHFEATLASPGVACILLRGVALPIAGGEMVQIVLSWREVLNRTATARLQRDFVAALRQNRSVSPALDPFSGAFAQKPGA